MDASFHDDEALRAPSRVLDTMHACVEQLLAVAVSPGAARDAKDVGNSLAGTHVSYADPGTGRSNTARAFA